MTRTYKGTSPSHVYISSKHQKNALDEKKAQVKAVKAGRKNSSGALLCLKKAPQVVQVRLANKAHSR